MSASPIADSAVAAAVQATAASARLRTMQLQWRRAVPGDGEALAALYAESWPVSLKHLLADGSVPAAVVPALLKQRDGAFWEREMRREGSNWLMVFSDGTGQTAPAAAVAASVESASAASAAAAPLRLLGFVCWLDVVDSAPTADAEKLWIFVSPSMHGAGLGALLVDVEAEQMTRAHQARRRRLAEQAARNPGDVACAAALAAHSSYACTWAVPGNVAVERINLNRQWARSGRTKLVRTDAGSFPLAQWRKRFEHEQSNCTASTQNGVELRSAL